MCFLIISQMTLINYFLICCAVLFASAQDIEPPNNAQMFAYLKTKLEKQNISARYDAEQLLCEYGGQCGDKTQFDNKESFSSPETAVYEPKYGNFVQKSPLSAPDQAQTTHLHHHFHHYDVNGEQQTPNVPEYQRASKNYAFQRPPQHQGLVQPPQYSMQAYKQPYGNKDRIGGNAVPLTHNNLYLKNPNINRQQNFVQQPFQQQQQFLQQQQIEDCTCVPYEYCSLEDVVDRRGDMLLPLPLDPRSNSGTTEEDEEKETIYANESNQTETSSRRRRQTDTEAVRNF